MILNVITNRKNQRKHFSIQYLILGGIGPLLGFVMYFKKIFYLIVLVLICVSGPACLCADGDFVLNGSYNVANSTHIEVKRLLGNGFVRSKKITILCEEFCFEGTIECSEEFELIIDSEESEEKPLDFKQMLIGSHMYQKLRELIGNEK